MAYGTIILLGPQGSGKGTQAELLGKTLGIPSVSTGGTFRREIAAQTDLGTMISTYVNQGLLVPDDITIGVIESRLAQDDVTNGVILDGYPRNVVQAQALEKIKPAAQVIFINVSEDEAVTRIHGRIVCQCGLSYHLRFNPPKSDMTCDRCGQKLYHRRDDDAENALRKRLEIYHQQISQLLDFYRAKGVLYEINGEQDIATVHAAIMAVVKPL